MAFRPTAVLCGSALAVAFATSVAAQEPVTITGHVSAASGPLRGATVRIGELDLGASTDADGYYSFIVPSSRVRGQTVTITARYLRYQPRSVKVTLVGGALAQDFVLDPVGQGNATRPSPPVETPGNPPGRGEPASELGGPTRVNLVPPVPQPGHTLDSTVFSDAAGAADIPALLAGRIPGVAVTVGPDIAGAEPIVVRGPRSIVGSNQPLFVVDGQPIANSSLATSARQVFGGGGFDYGSPIQGINPADVATVEVLSGPAAAALYGGRGANGVVLITTKDGRGLNGWDIAASQQVTGDDPLRLPRFQNLFGQGLDGLFEFFDGRGGGVNDSVAQSWGPALSGQPVAQASLTEAGRADVRPWLARPDNVSGFFDAGKTFTTNASAQGSNSFGHARLGLNTRTVEGLSPSSGAHRQGASLALGGRPSSRLDVNGDLQYVTDHANDRPGTGLDASNSASELVTIGRQVDVGALRDHRLDASGAQISWNYAGHDNPSFQPFENSNSDRRSHVVANGAATYSVSPAVGIAVRGGADNDHETQSFSVAHGWMGAYPVYLGRADLSLGGAQDQTVDLRNGNIEALLSASPQMTGSTRVHFTGGAGYYTTSVGLASTLTVNGPTPDSTPAPASLAWNANGSTRWIMAGAQVVANDAARVDLTVRQESIDLLTGGSDSHLYPAITASYDVVSPASGASGGVTNFRLRAGWGRSGVPLTAEAVQAAVFAAPAPATLDGSAFVNSNLVAPTTGGWELGADLSALRDRLSVSVTYYSERTSDAILPIVGGGASGAAALRNGATLSSSGIESLISLWPVRQSNRFSWRADFNASRNTSKVVALDGGASSVPLGPSVNGVMLAAQVGQPLGVLVGTTLLRDPATHELLLKNGTPIADQSGPHLLGATQPDWRAGLTNTIRMGGLELSVLVDGQLGGHLFSLTNQLGQRAGTLIETAVRPDSGLLISGIDSASGQANSKHVSAQDYFHALGAVQEPWVYDASFLKLRDARVSYVIPLTAIPGLHAQSARISLIGRNLALWSKVPNVDPETALSTSAFQGIELGQLPSVRSLGLQFTLTP